MTMVPATFDWSDIGEWQTIYASSKKRKDNHAIVNPKTQFLSINSQNCLVSGLDKKLIGPKYSEVRSVRGGNFLMVKTKTGKTGYVNAEGTEFFDE